MAARVLNFGRDVVSPGVVVRFPFFPPFPHLSFCLAATSTIASCAFPFSYDVEKGKRGKES